MAEIATPASSDPTSKGLVTYFVGAYAITWGLQLPAVLAQRGLLPIAAESLMPLVLLGIFGPTIAAVLVCRAETGAAGVRALFRPLKQWRVNVLWYVVALGLQGALLAAGLAIYGLASGHEARSFYLPDAQRAVAMVVISFAEEIGWRGFALPRLQRRYSPLVSSVILGVLWAFWHVPMFLGQQIPMALMPLMIAFFVPGTIIYTWIYNGSGGSLLLAVLAHIGSHLNNSHRSLPGDTTPLVVHTVGFVLVAIVIVLSDRRR
jgi:membrane protease YdiL (CAAX protease family)